MKIYLNTGSRAIFVLLLFFGFGACPNWVFAQKILSETETRYVLEAQQELNAALSDPAMDQAERMRIVERSAKTLKEYGQAPAFPNGSIPLKKFMQNNYELAKNQYNDANELRRFVNNMNHEFRMKFINQLQIEVVEEQVKFLFPGYTPFTLSQSLVNTNLDFNIVDGVNRGDVDDARTLVMLFKESAAMNKLSGQLDKLFNDHKFTVENLHRDLRMVEPLEAQLRKRYEIAAAGTHTIRGYEGARLFYGMTPVAASTPETKKLEATSQSINIINVILEGLHLFNYSAEPRYDGDKNLLPSGAFVIGFMLQGPNSFNGHYAKFSSFTNSGSAGMGGQVRIGNRWTAQSVMPREQPHFDFTGTLTAEGDINQGVLLRLQLKETAQRIEYEMGEMEKVAFRASIERQLELLNVPLMNYPSDLNRKNGTNYVYYAELEGPRVRDVVKLVKDSEILQYSDGKRHESQLLNLGWNLEPKTHKLKIYFGTYKPFVRDW